MSRRDISQVDYSAVPPSKCAKVFYYTWKICSVVFSHFVMISLVIAYCILGAFTFEKLEADNEKDVKRSISKIRGNVTQNIWQLTTDMAVLHPDNWTYNVVHQLKKFEGEILTSMKQRGWDGEESTEHIQWTFTGALFYSIIVITTIGYGHIAPKTQPGKVVTIFYAILGIPLMLLCLSNIGDVMASSFRFLYWRVCCYVCTRPPKPRRRSTHRRSMRASTRRRHPHSDTENRCRDSRPNSSRKRRLRPHSQPPLHTQKRSHYHDEPVEKCTYKNERLDSELEKFPKVSLPLDDLEAALYELEQHQRRCQSEDFRSKSLPRPSSHKKYNRQHFRRSDDFIDDSCDDGFIHADPRFDIRENREAEFDRRQMSQRYNTYGGRRFVDRCADRDYEPDDEDFELYPYTKNRNMNRRKFVRGFSEYHNRDAREIYNDDEARHKRARSAIYNYEQGHRVGAGCQYDERYVGENRNLAGNNRKRLRRLDTRDEISKRGNRYSPSSDREEENWSDLEANHHDKRYRNKLQGSSFRQSEMQLSVESTAKPQIKPVPIWLCVMLVASYIVAGSFLFQHWENWQFLDATYFCFVTLTTIGFGDFVPAQGGRADKTDAVKSIALCSLYLLFGISLLAMSFNLVQEEVIANVKAVAKKLGIIKSEGDSDEETE